MSKQIEALKLALEALEFFKGLSLSMGEIECAEKAITALRKALAEPAQQQEPVANELKLHIIRKWPEGFQERLQHVWLDVVSFIPDVKLYDLQRVLAEFGFTMKVYEGGVPASKPWVGLTDEEVIDHFQNNVDTGSLLSFADGARYAEAKLKEKNA